MYRTNGWWLGRPGERNRRSSIASSRFLFAGTPDRVLDAARLQRLVDRRPREGGVGPERDALSLGLLAVDLGHEQFLPVVRAGDVPRSQLRRHAITVIGEQKQRVVADRLEVPVVGTPFLLPVYRALAGVHVEHRTAGSVARLRLSDQVAVHGHQPDEVVVARQ